MGVTGDPTLHIWALAVGPQSQIASATALPFGVHLRWGCDRAAGLPWGGFYLLRRPVPVDNGDGTFTLGGTSDFTQTVQADDLSGLLGWQLVPGLVQPIALPVIDPDYPASAAITVQGNEKSEAAAKAYGFARVKGGLKADLEARFDSLYPVLQAMVAQGPAGGAMGDRETTFAAAPGGDFRDPELAPQSTLDLALLGVAYPEYAQLLGLYAIDAAAAPGTRWDYAVVADFANTFNGSAGDVVAWADAGMPLLAGVRARVVANIGTEPSGLLPRPTEVRAYTLPIPSMPVAGKPQTVQPYFAAAGLVWDCAPLTEVQGDPPPRPNLFKVRRATQAVAAKDPENLDAFSFKPQLGLWLPLQDKPVWHLASGEPEWVRQNSSLPAHWPPYAPQFVDPQLAEGWHAWRVQAMDWFGRVSVPSALAQWRNGGTGRRR